MPDARHALALVLAMGALGCSHRSERHLPPTAPLATPKNATLVANGAALRTIDWGGQGEVLLFVAGLGATAHAFDEFAPRFTDRFHVLGVTRRDDAALTANPHAFETDTLADDLDAVLGGMGIERANVVAHSFGGAELTCLATRHAARVHRAVYLDAAYDHAKGMALYGAFPNVPPPPSPSATDAASPDAYSAYLDRTFGFRMPRSEAEASYRFEGGHAAPTVPGPVFGALLKGEKLCDYAAMHAPAMAIYAMLDTPGDMARFVRENDDIAEKSRPLYDALAARQREDMARFTHDTPKQEVVPLHRANHWVFLSNADEVEQAMRRFLKD